MLTDQERLYLWSNMVVPIVECLAGALVLAVLEAVIHA